MTVYAQTSLHHELLPLAQESIPVTRSGTLPVDNDETQTSPDESDTNVNDEEKKEKEKNKSDEKDSSQKKRTRQTVGGVINMEASINYPPCTPKVNDPDQAVDFTNAIDQWLNDSSSNKEADQMFDIDLTNCYFSIDDTDAVAVFKNQSLLTMAYDFYNYEANQLGTQVRNNKDSLILSLQGASGAQLGLTPALESLNEPVLLGKVYFKVVVKPATVINTDNRQFKTVTVFRLSHF